MVPFFGQPAHTPAAAALLALRFDAPIILGWCLRVGDGFQLHFERHPVRKTADRDRDIHELTAELTARLEAAIIQAPAQWVWFHRRWKTRPPE